ncbi:hypothetical protein KDN32_05455 [Nocardioides sp. J2M5]|uniref:hypothetical protein n=1 Tax=Nocardioides palaemonis TaxID=2829810 RepID=UPI001BA63681|nr:hypothetical protein [Nocardioides palaemonis]MBS2937183.1 hypothetical protein [Nocardioides palaemonis]
MLLHLPARLLGALLSAGLLLAAAGPAHAERVVVRDASHDVVTLDLEASEAASHDVVVPASGEATTDITRVVVDHGDDALRVVVHVRSLRDAYYDLTMLQLRSQQRLWGVTVQRSGDQTWTALSRGHRESSRTCGGLVTEVGQDRLAITVPTTCLEDPRWVRVGVARFTGRIPGGSGTEDDAVIAWDEAGVTGFEDDILEVRGPKIHRG